VKREYWKYFPLVLGYVGRHKRLAAASLILMVISGLAAVMDPWPLAFLVDNVLGSHHPPTYISGVVGTDKSQLLLFAVLAGFGVVLVTHALAVLTEYVNTKLDQTIALAARSDLFAHVQTLSQSFHDEMASGDFMYRINFEARAFGGVALALLPFAQSILTLIAMFVIALRLDSTLALLSLTVVPFIYYSTGFYGNKIEPRLIAVRQLEALSLTMVNTAMAMLRVITTFNRQKYEHQRFYEQGTTAVNARVRVTVYQTLFTLSITLLTAAGLALVLFVGARDVLSGKLTIGQLLVIIWYINAIYQPLQTISSTLSSFQVDLIAVRFARQLFDKRPEVTERSDALAIERAAGHIVVENVSFDYLTRKGVLSAVSFEVRPGQVLAIVGATGAGKSTLVSLLPRFFDPRDGRVLLDGVDIRDLTLHSLREQIAFVHQEPLLFPTSIRENIGYGRVGASTEEIVEAAKAANAHDFIVALPEKYETRLGERGVKASGGERQRIAIARAFLKNAPILVLDEPTSSIDLKTEAAILGALERLMKGRTTIIIAHRLSTVRGADHVVVLDHGRVVEQGGPEMLRRQGGVFAEMHALHGGTTSLPSAQPDSNAIRGSRAVTGHESQPGSIRQEFLQFRGRGSRTNDLETLGDGHISGNVYGNESGGKRPVPGLGVLNRPKIVVLGMMSKMPVAGVIWQTVHYLVGLERLGFEAYYVEAHGRTPSMLMRNAGDDSAELAAEFIGGVMSRFGLGGRWCFHALHSNGRCYGMSRPQLATLFQTAALIINLHGGTQPLAEHSATGRLVYLETDPVQLQIELFNGRQETLDFLSYHSLFFTFAENYGQPDCLLPVSNQFKFRTTRQPVLLDFWSNDGAPRADEFTTIGNWKQQWREVKFRGETYHWSKHSEFMRFLDVPSRTKQQFELALSSLEPDDAALLSSHGWRMRSALEVSTDLNTYQSYIKSSLGEFTVAKDQNVRLRSGWFSDRSATYLAAGRPVITQDTGFGCVLPVGSGLFAFSTYEDVEHAVAEVTSHYSAQSEAARDVAREFFAHDVVLGRLLMECGVERRSRSSSSTRARSSMTVPFPAAMVIEPTRKRPLSLPAETVRTILSQSAAGHRSHERGPAVASIVVVAYGNGVFTRLCLESILANTSTPYHEVIVVDNGSDQDTVAYLRTLESRDERLRLFLNPRNVGFAAAANLGLRAAVGKFLLLLNNDTIVTPSWLHALTAHLEDRRVGIVSPAAPEGHLDGPAYRTYGELLVYAADRLNAAGHTDVDMMPMYCVAMRREVYERIGPLDEDFGIGMFEDDDYCVRQARSGYLIRRVRNVYVHHFGEASFGELAPSGEYTQLFEANKRRFEEKWGLAWQRHQEVNSTSGYEAMRMRVWETVENAVPTGTRLAVISKGDDELLKLGKRTAFHFPPAEFGMYAGFYPKDSAEAVAQVITLRGLGCEFLVVPETARWWLSHYGGLQRYLDEHGVVFAEVAGTCIIFRFLRKQAPQPSGPAQTKQLEVGIGG
jgi:ATP-binding cassette, subfamily B, bacterial